jgi:hypothetical protein
MTFDLCTTRYVFPRCKVRCACNTLLYSVDT